jgi:DNA-binding CsgD family transcriptional regulator
MHTDLSDVLCDLGALKSKDAFKRKLDRTFASFGFNLYCYVGIKGDLGREPSSTRSADDAIFLTNVPVTWTDRYLEQSYQDDDPIIRECLASRLPLKWTEQLKTQVRSDREDMVLADALDFGIRRGLTVPIHGPGGELGIMSLYSDLSDREFLQAVQTTQHDLHVMSIHFHDAVQRTLAYGEQIPKPIPLTDREVEILRWTASGKTAWEIGSILKISERTVNFHLQNLMGKLGVHNKTHAAAKAMSFGLIQAA